MKSVQSGLEIFLRNPPKWIGRHRIGLLGNPASVDRQLKQARFLIEQRFPGQLKAIFSPQHGFFSAKQDNMIESQDMIDPILKIPVYSLYGKTRIPEKAMLDDVDILIIDLQDVGTRVYTFASTVSYCLEAAAQNHKKVLVLDRPNPIGGREVEGNCLISEYASFVGRYPIPMRHGLTMGEFSKLVNDQFNIGCDLEVVPMQKWKRSMYFTDTGLPWVAPSPNLPSPSSAMVYPGQVIWEGTNVSEGRGTTQPFEYFGAPFFDPQRIRSALGEENISGCILREVAFEPLSNKWEGSLCRGFQIHVVDPNRYKPYETSLRLLQAVIASHGDSLQWKTPPYEYEFEKLPIDMIIGDPSVRRRLQNLENLNDIIVSWNDALAQFRSMSKVYYLYA